MRPNILFLFSDQQRWDTVSCYGQPIVDNLTPNLDKLAAQGVRFQHAFTCQPVCGPARACLQTGLYATEAGVPTNGYPLKLEADTLAKRLNAADYETAYIGKWHLASDRETGYNVHTEAIPEERRGGYQDYWLAADILEFTSSGYEGFMFDQDNRRVDFEGYRVDCVTNFVLDYLRDYQNRQPDKPFFLMTSWIEPHHQNDLNRYIGPIGSKQRFADYRTPGDLEGLDGDWQLHLPDYLGCCWSLDRNVGRIREELNVLGLAENTLIIYVSDHGSHFRTRNSEYKRSCHDGSLRVPLIVAGPGFEGGQVVEEPVSLIDLPPTVIEAAGAEPLAGMQGHPLQALANGSDADRPDHIFAQLSESQCGRCIRDRRWKYSVFAPDKTGRDSASDHYEEHYLYDLEADPWERHNLITEAAHADRRAELAAKLIDRIEQVEGYRPQIVPAREAYA